MYFPECCKDGSIVNVDFVKCNFQSFVKQYERIIYQYFTPVTFLVSLPVCLLIQLQRFFRATPYAVQWYTPCYSI